MTIFGEHTASVFGRPYTGRAFGTMCRLSSVCLSVCRLSSVTFSIVAKRYVLAKKFRCYGHQDGRFCLIFARIAQQSVLDGANGVFSSKPCAYCRIVRPFIWTV